MSRVRLDVGDGVATVTLAAAATRNALDIGLVEDWLAAVEEAVRRDDVRAIVVRADGPAWCVGGSIDTLREAADDVHDLLLAAGGPINRLVSVLHESPKITVAAVHGAVAGGGLGLMAAHDVVLAADDTRFAVGYARIAQSPDAGSSYFLARDVGYRRALELYLTNERFDAETAERLGIVNRVVAAHDLDAESSAFASRVAAGPARAQATTKRLLGRACGSVLARHLDDEIRSFADNTRDAAFAEGVRAFLEHREPRF